MNVIVTAPPRDLETHYFDPDNLRLKSISWPNFLAILLIHVGALAAPFFFSWQGLATMLGLYWFTGCVGVTLCYHRMLTHRGFRLHPVARTIAHLAGALSMQGKPLEWAMSHRIHHARSDQPGDPHSPLDGAWWSHFVWLLFSRSDSTRKILAAKYIPDLAKDGVCVFFDRTYLVWNVVLAAALFYLGGLSCFLWGFCLRTALVYHMTWLINSARLSTISRERSTRIRISARRCATVWLNPMGRPNCNRSRAWFRAICNAASAAPVTVAAIEARE